MSTDDLLRLPIPSGRFPHVGDGTPAQPSDLDVSHKPQPTVWSYPPETVELAFLCWIESDRHIPRAMRRFDAVSDGGRRPTLQTWHQWKKDYNWPAQADQAISDNFPHIRRRQLARLVSLADEALAIDAAIFAGELDHLPRAALQARRQTSHDIKLAAGLIIAASDAVPVVNANVPAVDDPEDTRSPRQRQLDRLQAQRDARERR